MTAIHALSGLFCLRAAGLVAAKLNSLGQWKFSRKINRVRLPAHVHFPRITSAFAAAASFLLATERPADFSAARAGIHIRDATIASGGAEELLGLAHVVGENR